MEELSKKKRLLSSAYQLFVKNGFNKTTIQDIVDAANVAKGTFYLYFEDKYKLQEDLIKEKSKEIFNEAINELEKHKIKKFDDQIIFVVDYLIDVIKSEPGILNFISKDLSLGLTQDKLSNIIDQEDFKLYDMFINGAKENNIKFKRPDITLFMIIEFVSASVFSVVTGKINITIDEYKPYLHRVIRSIINS